MKNQCHDRRHCAEHPAREANGNSGEGIMPHRIFAWAALIFFFSAAPAWSWSGKGHRIVGAIADEVLKKNPTTKAKVKEILGGQTLATVSVWADCAKGFMY